MSQHDTISQNLQPSVCKDPRFRGGRKLMERGQAQLGAVKIFSLLMDRAEEEFGDFSLDFAAVGYEYGFALFLEKTHSENGEYSTSCTKSKDANGIEHNVEAALQHMVKACTTLYAYLNQEGQTHDSSNSNSTDSIAVDASDRSYFSWVREQIPRYLIGIGYVLSHQGKHSDALDSYLNALPCREEILEKFQKDAKHVALPSLGHVKAHRLVAEVYVLIAEEILKCSCEEDTVTSETNIVLIKKGERKEMAQGYYEKARGELQEVILLMSKLPSESQSQSEEKEMVCHLATMVMEAGISLSTVTE